MKNTRLLTLIAGIIDAVVGVGLIILSIIAFVEVGKPIPDDAGVAGIGIAFAMVILVLLGVICAILGLLFAIYGVIFILLAVKQSKNINRRRKALKIMSILELIAVAIALIYAIIDPSVIIISLIASVILITTAVLKLIDCKNMKNSSDTLQKPVPENNANTNDNTTVNDTQVNNLETNNITVNDSATTNDKE